MTLDLLYRRKPLRMPLNQSQRIYVERLRSQLARGPGEIGGHVDKTRIHLIYRGNRSLNPFQAAFYGKVDDQGGNPQIDGYVTMNTAGKLLVLALVAALFAGGFYALQAVAAANGDPRVLITVCCLWLFAAVFTTILVVKAAAPASRGVIHIVRLLEGTNA